MGRLLRFSADGQDMLKLLPERGFAALAGWGVGAFGSFRECRSALRHGAGDPAGSDFSIEPRSFQFLTGPSGAGKTTLLRLILLSLKPTRGLVSLFGRDISTITGRNSPPCAGAWGLCFRTSACSTI